MARHRCGHPSGILTPGFTLIELVVTVAIVAVLASGIMPMIEVTVQRNKEQELRSALIMIRNAIDGYKKATAEGRIARSADDSGYPRTLESLADGYYPIVDKFDKRVDEMEAELFKDPTTKTFNQIYRLKNDTMFLRRTIGPQVDVFSILTRGDFPLIKPSNYVYFRNVYDHLVRINDIVGTSRDIVTGALEAYVSIVSNRLNEAMKVLTIIATIMLPFVVIPSIYGMNLKLPFAEHQLAFWIVMGLTVAFTAVIFGYLKRKKWF